MKQVIFNQILGTLIISFIFVGFTFFAIVTKEIIVIIISIVLGILTLLFALNSIKVIKKVKGIKVKYDFNYGVIIGFIAILLIFVVCLYYLIDEVYFRINAGETTSIVYDIDKETKYKTEYDDDGNSYIKKEEKCDVYIKYSVENKEYNSKLDNNSCKYSIGDDIKIYYDKDDPSYFTTSSIALLIIVTLFSGIVLIIYLVQWIKSYLKEKNY
ncbi:MAG: DUF3592 domain-containing protein [Bacilli bacterium]